MLGYLFFFQFFILNLTVAFKFPKCLGFMWLLFCQLELVVLVWMRAQLHAEQNKNARDAELQQSNPSLESRHAFCAKNL